MTDTKQALGVTDTKAELRAVVLMLYIVMVIDFLLKKNECMLIYVPCGMHDDEPYCDGTACLIGGEKLVSKFREEPELKCVVTDSDKQASKEAVRASRERQFTWVQLSAFADLLAGEDQPGNMDPEGRGRPPHKHSSEDQKRVGFCPVFLLLATFNTSSWKHSFEL